MARLYDSQAPQNQRKQITFKAYEMDSPTSPLFKESREITANNAAKNTTRFPRDSKRMANHLKPNEQH